MNPSWTQTTFNIQNRYLVAASTLKSRIKKLIKSEQDFVLFLTRSQTFDFTNTNKDSGVRYGGESLLSQKGRTST